MHWYISAKFILILKKSNDSSVGKFVRILNQQKTANAKKKIDRNVSMISTKMFSGFFLVSVINFLRLKKFGFMVASLFQPRRDNICCINNRVFCPNL
jgi:hypothetical protein